MEAPEIERILVPVDFSEIAAAVMAEALYLARKLEAELCLIHVAHISHLEEAGAWLDPVISPILVGEIHQNLKNSAQARLTELAEQCRRAGREAQTALIEGMPHVEIVRFAQENDIDLIVMGSSGGSRISQMLMGSVADRVIHGAPCHVLCIKSPEKTEAK